MRPIAAAFVKYLAGPRATDSFRKRGMLLVKDEWPAVPTLARAASALVAAREQSELREQPDVVADAPVLGDPAVGRRATSRCA